MWRVCHGRTSFARKKWTRVEEKGVFGILIDFWKLSESHTG